MVRQKCDRPIDSKFKTPSGRRGETYQNGSDNEASSLKGHYNIIFHKTLAKAQVPINDERWRDLDRLFHVKIDIKMVVDGIFDMM